MINAFDEFRAAWLPNTSDSGLERIRGLLEAASPLLIHGAFTRVCPMGCLATHIAWNHPRTSGGGDEAGVAWLTAVAGLNPGTSRLLLAWDRRGVHDRELRDGLVALCRAEGESRALSC